MCRYTRQKKYGLALGRVNGKVKKKIVNGLVSFANKNYSTISLKL